MKRLKIRREKPIQGKVRVGKRSRGIIFLAKPSTLSVIFSTLAMILLVVGLMAGGVPVIWMVWYRLDPGQSATLAQILKRPAIGFDQSLKKAGLAKEVYQPPLDPSLPKENRLIIKKIGVDTVINERPDDRYEEALRLGVWRTPEFGTAFNRERPMILVAHRFGYVAWTNTYRHLNSFYNLPKLEPGDQVEVIWNQRRYLYQIYAGEEAEEVSQYTADLILYTCKFLESDVRIFRYGRLIEKKYFEVEPLASPSGTVSS